MAENNVEPYWSSRPQLNAEDTLLGMECLLATLGALEDELKQHDISETYSTDYCDNFCQILMHYAGSRNSVEHGLSLLEVYCLSINCFAAARPYLTAESDSVALVLKRLALSCFELLLSVPDNEIPYDTWVQFHQSVQVAHEALLQYGSTDLQALLQITGEGGAWSNLVLAALLTGQPTNTEDVDAYIALEGEGFMEMRVKHLEKVGEVAKAVVLAKACTESPHISNHANFRHTYVSLLCHLLPNEEAIVEISRLDCKDVLEITCNLEAEGEERIAFILCTTVLTQQLQQQSLYCSWELTLLWSKLQRRIDPALESLLERCLQLGAIAKTVNHLFYLVRVIRTEAEEMGLASSVELCVKALQLPKKEDAETRISVCSTISCVLQEDLEVLRACQLTEFLLGPCQEAFGFLEELYRRPDQKYDQENPIIPNSLRCELLLALKAHWPFDPEFWDWKTLKYHCGSLLGLELEAEEGREEGVLKPVKQESELEDERPPQSLNIFNGGVHGQEEQGKHEDQRSISKKSKFCCQICKRLVCATQILHHSKRHVQNNIYTCPVCLETFQIRKDLIQHTKQQHQMALTSNCKKAKKRIHTKEENNEKKVEPVQYSVDPSLMLPYQTTHDPHHIVEQAKSATVKQTDKDEYVTFDYINTYFQLQNHEGYSCPASRCRKIFKHFKNLWTHVKTYHKGDHNAAHYFEMRDRKEKCVFCRRHFVSPYHLRKHQKVHLTDNPFMCVSVGCNSCFSFTNDLVLHRQTHAYQFNYQCELKGCYATFPDLVRLFHHEAQHFRDAAFSCTSPDCRKFFFSKKEYTEHLASHGITYSEEDFVTQRKSKQKLLKIIANSVSSNKLSDSLAVLEDINKSSDLSASSPSSASMSNVPNSNEGINMTPVAVCFDGSKFTCGFEKCGMTFSRARDVQRHLNCAHHEHLRSENKEHKKRDKERGSNSKVPKVKTEEDNVEKNKYDHNLPQTKGSDVEQIFPMPFNNNETTTSGLAPYDSLNEILIGLCSLNLNSQCFENEPCDSTRSNSGSSMLQMSIHQTVREKSGVAEQASKQSMSRDQEINDGHIYTKPYTCEFTSCKYRSSLSSYLGHHYMRKHKQTLMEAKIIGKLRSPSYIPLVCRLCSKRFRENRNLKAHYKNVHQVNSEVLIDQKTVLQSEPKKCTAPLKTKHRLWTKEDLKVKKRDKPNWQQRYQKRKVSMMKREKFLNGKFGNKKITFQKNPPSEEEKEEDEVNEEEEYDADEVEGIEKNLEDKSEVKSSEKGRDTMHLVSKSNLCYILTQYRKPFRCVVEDCIAAFADQDGLVRHLKTVHSYSRSQLALENDLDFEKARSQPTPRSDEPLSQYRCGFDNCDASFLLKSSLVRHTLENHCQPSDQVRCMYEGCTRVFDQLFKLKKHILHNHSRYYDSYVLRLQSTHKKSISGCQKKLIVPLPSGHTDSEEEPAIKSSKLSTKSEAVARSEDTGKEETREIQLKNGNVRPIAQKYEDFVYRSHEEALQMCQDRSLRAAYPCMVQNCVSVVKIESSLRRHYLTIHGMTLSSYVSNHDKLVFTAEQLEEIIQRKSAQMNNTVTRAPNGVLKMEYQAEPEKPGGPSAPMSLHSIKTETCDEDNHNSLGFAEEAPPPVETNVLVGTDDLLYGELDAGGQTHEPTATQNNHVQEEKHRRQNTNPAVVTPTVDLSPPSSLRISIDEGFVDMSSSKDGGKMPNTPAQQPSAPVRQPLKRKNELSAHQSNLKDSHPSISFDITTYKPMGFESSFLKFIQETTATKEQDTLRCRESYKRSCSVKENNQMGITLTRSKRTRTTPQKTLPITGDLISVQDLRSILDKSLTGCGDMAIKQLQYLKPVVVLERPTAFNFVTDHFPKITNDVKLLIGS